MKRNIFKIFAVIALVMTLFIFVACKQEPVYEGTATPAAGGIPQIPNDKTTLLSVGDAEKAKLAVIMQDITEFVDQMKVLFGDEEEDNSKGLSRDLEEPLASEPKTAPFAVIGTVSFSAPAASLAFDDFTLANTAFTGTITGSETGLALKTEDTTITYTPAEGEPAAYAVSLSLTYDFEELAGTLTVGEDEFDMSLDEEEKLIIKQNSVEVGDETYDLLSGIGLAALNGLLKGKIDLDVEGTVFGVAIKATGKIGLDITLNPDYFAEEDSDLLPFKNNGKITVNLTIEASSEEIGLSGKIELKDFEVSVKDYLEAEPSIKDDTTTEKTTFTVKVGFSKLLISAKAGETGNEIKLNLDLTNASFEVDVQRVVTTIENELASSKSVKTTLGAFKTSADIGLGLGVGENSIGFVINVAGSSAELFKFNPDTDMTITAKAAVLNGAYYDPEQFIAALTEISEAMDAADDETQAPQA